MPALTLDHHDRQQLLALANESQWIVACLCAAWCDVCKTYRVDFDRLADAHPDKRFVWIDIEDQADLIGDIDVENFPTLLMQRGETIPFFGTVLPDARLAERLILAQTEAGSVPKQDMTRNASCNLRELARKAANASD